MPGLEEVSQRLEVVLEAFLCLESARDFQSRLEEKDAHSADASYKDVAREEADQRAQAAYSQQQEGQAGEDG